MIEEKIIQESSIIFEPEDGVGTFLRNGSELLTDYTASYASRDTS
jgi:hypothetical protein